MSRNDLSRSESTIYVCRCGTLYSATVWRWIDADARPERAEAARQSGPVEGTCPSCGATARTGATWLRVRPTRREATLVIDGGRRANLIAELQEHLTRLADDPGSAVGWLLRPGWEFTDHREETTARRSIAEVDDGELPRPVARRPSTLVKLPKVAVRADVREAAKAANESNPVANEAAAAKEAKTPSRGAEESDLAPLPDPAALFAEPFSDQEGSEAPPAEAKDPSAAPLEPAADVDSAGLTSPAAAASRSEPVPPTPSRRLAAGIPQVIGHETGPAAAAKRSAELGVHVCSVALTGGAVRATVNVAAEALGRWKEAHLDARPIHLRGHGYPLVGVRLVAKHFGQVGCADAVVDPGDPRAAEVFRALSESFSLTFELRHGDEAVSRSVAAAGLEPNAALCFESARGLLARGEYPPEEFARARARLEGLTAAERLAPSRETVSVGAYQHIVGAAEAAQALEHLDRVSQKESLARLLEVDGMPMGEYDAIRRRVLEGSLEHGLIAPRRFWRRLVASGIAEDLQDYARKLAANRAAHEGEEGDLADPHSRRAWEEIRDLCERKALELPAPVVQALSTTPDATSTGASAAEAGSGGENRRRGTPPSGTAVPGGPGGPRAAAGTLGATAGTIDAGSGPAPAATPSPPAVPPTPSSGASAGAPSAAAPPPPPRHGTSEIRAGELRAGEIRAGEIRAGEIEVGGPSPGSGSPPLASDPPVNPVDAALRDPGQRLRAATDILQGHASGDVDQVIAALEEFDTDELLAIMPDLSDLGPRAVPGLIDKLRSERREVRQAAVILLGMSQDASALESLADHLVREPTTVWVDVARALGSYGPSVIRSLCQILRREAATEREAVSIDRVARALAEIALSDASDEAGSEEASGSAAVSALADADDPRVSTAARRALASLKDVRTSGAQIRGEIPLAENTEVRGFSRRAYEAIMVPELEVEAEA